MLTAKVAAPPWGHAHFGALAQQLARLLARFETGFAQAPSVLLQLEVIRVVGEARADVETRHPVVGPRLALGLQQAVHGTHQEEKNQI